MKGRISDVNQCPMKYYLAKKKEPNPVVAKRIEARMHLISTIHDYFLNLITQRGHNIMVIHDTPSLVGHIDGLLLDGSERYLVEVKTVGLYGHPEVEESWEYQVNLYFFGTEYSTNKVLYKAYNLKGIKLYVCNRETAEWKIHDIEPSEKVKKQAIDYLKRLYSGELIKDFTPPFSRAVCKFWCPYFEYCRKQIRTQVEIEDNEIAREYYDKWLKYKELEKRLEYLKDLLKIAGPAKYRNITVFYKKTLDWDKLKQDYNIDFKKYYTKEELVIMPKRR